MHNDLTFFTNEPERTLYERFGKILRSNTKYFDILVGYFRTSGFFRLYPFMNEVEKIRVLVGLNVDYKTIEIIEQSENEITEGELSNKEAKEALTHTIKAEFNKSADSVETEKGVRIFIDWLKSGKLELRMYTESPIHAKVYIMRKDMEKTPDTYGSVITGSSNFSEAGLKNNLEFNVELKDSRDVKFALEHFEKLWSKGINVKETYINTVEKDTWLRADITPYELYLKTLYEFFKEEINADKETSIEKYLPDSYMRLQYQLDAVVQAKKILESYNGVFISDVVGLGKTYICALLAKSLKKGKKLVICPPVLIDYWKDVLLEFDVAATVESLGKLDKLIDSGVDGYEYVFIDEAHRFRNQDTQSFSLLHQICHNKKVVLISATPINNYSTDIANQIYLFQPKHNCTIIPNQRNIEGFFARLNGKLAKLEKGTTEYNIQLRKNSEEIRNSILRHVMIRRTRKEIIEYYSEDLKRQGLTFPTIGTPEQIIYTFDDKTDDAFSKTIAIIKRFNYARYTPLLYLKDSKDFATQLVAQRNMGGFMKGILVKRLESSFYAFRMTLNRFIESYEQFIKMVKSGDVYISKKINVYDLLDSGDDERLMKLVDSDEVLHFKADEFKRDFIPALEMDLAMLKNLNDIWMNITVDPKLEEFKKELCNNEILKDKKIIIFTESTETANYLEQNLYNLYKGRVVSFSGVSSSFLKRDIEHSFNPKYISEKEDKYDVLITTDVLAEGINLHRSNVLINYDLPWNPTKIMQRVGRVNRVGTSFDKIYVFNFFPTSQSSKQLPLKSRIIEKIQAFHDTLGEDFKYLSEDEIIGSYKLYEDLTGEMEEEVGTNPELAYLTVIRSIRDNDINLFGKIKVLPIKSKAGKISTLINKEETITFLRRGPLKLFFKSGNNTEQLTFIEAINYIKSKPDDKAICIGENYYTHLENNKQAFENKLIEQDVISFERITIGGNSAKMINILKGIASCGKLTDAEDDIIQKMITLWQSGEISQGITKQILKDIKGLEDPVQAFNEIYDRVPDIYLKEKKENHKVKMGEKQVILSCFLRNGGSN